MAPSFIVEGHGISHRYGNHVALSNFDLTLKAGEIVGLFGANGAGKTTTLKILCGLLKPMAGTLSLMGHPVSEVLSRVGIVPENPAFYPNMSALDNLELACLYAGRYLTTTELRSYLSQVGLENLKGKVKGFSLGMRQRLALAIALAKEPDLFLLDEPTNGLDLDGVELLRTLLRQQIEKGRACILSTHNWDEAERVVQRVVILHQGETLYNGPLAELVAPVDRWRIRCSAGGQAGTVLRGFPGVSVVSEDGHGEFVIELKQMAVSVVIERLVAHGSPPELVSPYHQPLAEIYRSLVKGGAQ